MTTYRFRTRDQFDEVCYAIASAWDRNDNWLVTELLAPGSGPGEWRLSHLECTPAHDVEIDACIVQRRAVALQLFTS